MSIGPLRRSIGAMGLLALVPIAGMMLIGALTPADAARRAITIVVALLVVGRMVGCGIDYLARSVERTAPEGPGSGTRTGARSDVEVERSEEFAAGRRA